MPNATITVDAALKERLADLAGQTGQRVDEFVEALLRRIADADVRFERGVPVFPRRPELPRSRSKTLTASPTAGRIASGVADLLDVNVLVALLVPEHQHHAASMEWFTTRSRSEGWATCAVTELGVIRVCAQLPGGAWPAETTADRLLLLTATGRDYVFWPDAVSPAVMPEVRTASTGKQITDRYLLGLARRHGGRVITFDRALAVAGGGDVVCLLPAGA